MGRKIKIRKIGNSQGVIIPKPILEEHNLDIGDYLSISEEDLPLILAKVDGMHDKNKKNK
jgi:putative addiction module antidote